MGRVGVKYCGSKAREPYIRDTPSVLIASGKRAGVQTTHTHCAHGRLQGAISRINMGLRLGISPSGTPRLS